MEEVFEEEHPLHTWVNATTSVEPEFDPHDRAWVEGELDDVHLLPEFETPLAPKRQKKIVGARVRSKQRGISIADLRPSRKIMIMKLRSQAIILYTKLLMTPRRRQVLLVRTPIMEEMSAAYRHRHRHQTLLYSLERKPSPMLLKINTMGVGKGGKHNKPQVNIMHGRERKWHLNSKGKAKANKHPKIQDIILTSFRIDGIG
ncbi:hypothetical protein Taro_014380 [Colocasia esculenta]|uniref:Uncharacterized protein n=1 Tax=Colocasia esculenta TaxID=4460 RepID=A0A843UIW9_COLES|nr:hypothetical protein [Colocasia esculenta]